MPNALTLFQRHWSESAKLHRGLFSAQARSSHLTVKCSSGPWAATREPTPPPWRPPRRACATRPPRPTRPASMHWLSGLVLGLWAWAQVTGKKKRAEDDPASLPDIDLDSLYFEAALHPSEATLIASTLAGTLVALKPNTGQVLWEIDDQPVVKSPYDASQPALPAFLPDPKDGSIYMIGGGLQDPLKKLPFTIPELVAASPCKSSDGILYTGKKVDTWISVDRYTGSKQGSISANGCVVGPENQCPNVSPTNFLIGRTEYNIMMYDSRAEGRKWNITFFDYSSNSGPPDLDLEYEYAHFTDSSVGSLVTLDRRTGVVQWEKEIGSPIVALFKLEGDGMVNVPFTSVSKETLENLMEQFNAPETNNELIGETKLFPTLYVGEHEQGLYAMPSLVDEQTLTISSAVNGPLLLEGPQNFHLPSEINFEVITDNGELDFDPLGIPMGDFKARRKDSSSVLLFGYYQVPEYSTIKLSPALTQLQLTSSSVAHREGRIFGKKPDVRLLPPLFPNPHELIHSGHAEGAERSGDPDGTSTYTAPYPFTPRNHSKQPQAQCLYDLELIHYGVEQLKSLNTSFIMSSELIHFTRELVPLFKEAFDNIENKELKVIAILLFVAVYCLVKLIQNNNPSHSSYRMNSSVGSTSSQSTYSVTAQAIDQGDGTVRVGQIYFNPNDTLGKGCEGTFVYRGKFDSRDVAVKRVLAACFSIADREVDLLRESDEHPNVIRYFCMEQDTQFRYIALELCAATLQDYVDGRYVNPKLDTLTILRQASQGLLHLHNLDIVHRDIKPQNVLISMPGSKGEIRAMISDFGLCKKLKMGRMSFSRRSGVAGTDGWIAPEVMLSHRSNTCSVDIFSLGCVFYYVMSNGAHPFGESFKRQANILADEHNLDKLTTSQIVERSLVEQMIHQEQGCRPTAKAVLRHPLFWSKEKVLNFLQDVSDRVDKEDSDSAIVLALERNKIDVVRGNWHDNLDPIIQEDLGKHRSYNGKSVRDLMRALRNKKHHYNELPPETKMTYGRIPDQYVLYWTRRFPKLLNHSWHAMHCIKNEPTFVKYFDRDFDFLQIRPKSRLDQPLLPESSIFSRQNHLFEPAFRHGSFPRGTIEDEDGEVFQEFQHSESSVVSRWSQIDTNASEPRVEPLASEFKDTPFELTAEADHKVGLARPQVRTKVAQLASEAKQRHLAEEWAKLAECQPTWAEAARNISAEDKVREAAAERLHCDKENAEPQVNPASNGNSQVEEASTNGHSNRLEADEKPSHDLRTRPAEEAHDSPTTNGDCPEEVEVVPPGGPIWILPPPTETPKKANKKKKSKKPK